MSAKQPDVNVRPGDGVKDIHVVFSPNPAREQLSALAAELDARREEILEAWRAYGELLPQHSAGSSLSRAQFNDHIPAVLDSLSNTLRAWPEPCDRATEDAGAENMAGHGMERWQQGYSLSEVLREWGYLQMCVAAELERYAAAESSLDRAVTVTWDVQKRWPPSPAVRRMSGMVRASDSPL